MLERPDSLEDTIVACATPAGEGAIAIVRLSGPKALAVGRSMSPGRKESRSHELVHAQLVGGDNVLIDDAMVVEMHAPHSYTGDDVVELHVHGSRAVVEAVIERAIAIGARLARPGEFTLRAFLNSRMDLTQAEAVADLISARSDAQRQIAANHLKGDLSASILEIVTLLEGVLAEWRAAVDFPDELPNREIKREQLDVIDGIKCKIHKILENARAQVRSGFRIVLCGGTNVGKSTLLNAWVGETRVLVDSAPGTTRDPVEVELFDGPIRWSVWDTAGMRREAEGLEARGIALSLGRIRKADVALWLVSPVQPEWPEDELATLPMSVVGAKADLATPEIRKRIEEEASNRKLPFLGWVSVRTGAGVSEVREALGKGLLPRLSADVPVLVRQRQIDGFRHAGEAIGRLLDASRQGASLDLLIMELEDALRALGRLLGRDVDQAVLDRIFSEFCLGK